MGDILPSFLNRRGMSGHRMRNAPHQVIPDPSYPARRRSITSFPFPFGCVHFIELLLDKFAAKPLSFEARHRGIVPATAQTKILSS